MSTEPKTLQDLRDLWKAQGGVYLGIVGDTRHTKGYHLGKDRIFDGSGPGIGWDDYSVKTSRDKAGLTNAASAMDIGKLNGTYTALWAFSELLARECMARKPDTKDIREVIYWDRANSRVVGWSALAPDRLIPNYGDASHKYHTHVSWYRDSEYRSLSKADLWSRLLGEDEMGLAVYLTATKDANPWDDFGTAKFTSGSILRVSDGASVALSAGASLGTVQVGTLDGKDIVAFNHLGQLHVVDRSRVTFTPMAPPSGPSDCTEQVQKAVAAAVAAEQTKCDARVAQAKTEAAKAEQGRIAEASAAQERARVLGL